MSPVRTLHQTPWLALCRAGTWDFVRRPHSDACVAILPITDIREIILVEQYRVPLRRRVIELPAGLVGDEPAHRGESLAATAGRELLEETGYRAGTIVPLIASPTSAGLTSEIVHLFHATRLTRETAGGGTDGEDITVHHVPLGDLSPWLHARAAEGLAIDFKIHAALWLAGIAP